MKTISGILALLGIAFLGLVFYQNLEPRIEILLMGQSMGPFSLSTLMLVFYLAGIGFGLLLCLGWAFDDALLTRRIKRLAGGGGSGASPGPSRKEAAPYRSTPEDKEPPIQPDILAEDEEPGDWMDR